MPRIRCTQLWSKPKTGANIDSYRTCAEDAELNSAGKEEWHRNEHYWAIWEAPLAMRSERL
jgi:hypothetical protein